MKPSLNLSAMPQPLEGAQSIALKVGSSLLVDSANGTVRESWMQAFAEDVASLMAAGKKIMLISSGAVALGRAYLGLKAGKLTLDEKQAAAAAGQPILMRAWEKVFALLGRKTAQILLTREDTENRKRWLNARETVATLMRLGVIAIVNENDTVATDEIKYGDNDRLAARASQLMQADLLVLLSDIDGLYAADPRKNPDAAHLPIIEAITPEIESMAGGANEAAGVGTGGMATKIAAAKLAGSAGAGTLIVDGRSLHPLSALKSGARCSYFKPSSTVAAAYKAWIAGTVAPAGTVWLDDGAVAALKRGTSLLPSGIVRCDGRFEQGDTVRVCDLAGHEIARGLVDYDAEAVTKIMGRSSKDIESLLGYSNGDTVIHRDDLVMM